MNNEYELKNTMEPITSELKEKLKAIGFTDQQFEPKVRNRFIVNMGNIPSHFIKAINLPRLEVYTKTDGTIVKKWEFITVTLYNPVNENLEKKLLEMGIEKVYDIQVKILSPVGDVLTTWKIKGNLLNINFGNLDWSDKGVASQIYLSFDVKDVTVE